MAISAFHHRGPVPEDRNAPWTDGELAALVFLAVTTALATWVGWNIGQVIEPGTFLGPTLVAGFVGWMNYLLMSNGVIQKIAYKE